MLCPKCGKENPDDARVCSGCSSPLPGASGPAERPITKTSRLAIAAFVLGVLSPFTLGITAIPAVVLGIISLVRIEKSGGRLTGIAFAVIGIVVPAAVCLLFIGIMLLALAKVRQTAFRMTCGTNLSGIGKAMIIYSNDYQDQFPRAGGRNSLWGGSGSVVWNARNRFQAYQMSADGAGGSATISSCFYLLTKYAEVTPKSFICKGDSRTREFRLSDYQQPDLQLIDLWDFGPVPAKHCSYTYHMPFGLYALTTSFLPGMAVAADRSPWLPSPAASAKTMAQFNPTGTNIDQQKYGNSISHQEDGQNVLFVDSHVYFEKRSYCAIKDDNIYTFWDGGDIRRGGTPVVGSSQPMDRKDSFLVHDPPAQGGK
jgi:hypothetical protein